MLRLQKWLSGAFATIFAAGTFAATTPSGGTWPAWFDATGTFTILAIGVDNGQASSGETGWVAFSSNFAGYTPCAWGILLIPFYYVDQNNGNASYNLGVNPAAKAMYNELLTMYMTGKTVPYLQYFQYSNATVLEGTNKPCILKQIRAT